MQNQNEKIRDGGQASKTPTRIIFGVVIMVLLGLAIVLKVFGVF